VANEVGAVERLRGGHGVTIACTACRSLARLPGVRFAVLGPLEVRAGDAVVDGLAQRQREIVARLLVTPNRFVPAERLLDELWDDPSSAGARSSLQAQVSRLRKRLPRPEVVVGDRRGYRLDVGPDDLDVWRFERLLGEGRAALDDGRPAEAAAQLDAALACWRGEAFDELAGGDGAARGEAARLSELRLIASADRVRVDLDRGRPSDALARLEPLLADHPFDERLWALRITALYASGRQADALQAFQRCRRLLVDELGLEPGADLRRIEQRVLDQDPDLGAPVRAEGPPAGRIGGAGVPSAATDAGLDLPPVGYVTTDDGCTLAYRVIGDGPVDVLWVPDYLSHLDVVWEHPAYAAYLRGLAGFGRLITYDKRGQGLSDRIPGHAPAAVRARDALAVLDAAGSERAVLVGCSEGAEIASTAAVLAPERVAALVLFGSGPACEADDADWCIPRDEYVRWIEWAAARWGTGRSLSALAPSVADDPTARAWYGRLERQTATPGSIATYARENAQTDYRSLLTRISAPTLVLHRTGDTVPVAAGRYLAAHIRGARYVELDGPDHLVWFGDTGGVLREIEAFLGDVLPAYR
jgi:DNA-binding SARP family transcriptional activator/pimeloyl-ACP methyl ester carboxylesterase